MEFVKDWQPLISVGIAIVFLLWKFPTKADVKNQMDSLKSPNDEEHDRLYKEVIRLGERIDRHLEFHANDK